MQWNTFITIINMKENVKRDIQIYRHYYKNCLHTERPSFTLALHTGKQNKLRKLFCCEQQIGYRHNKMSLQSP